MNPQSQAKPLESRTRSEHVVGALPLAAVNFMVALWLVVLCNMPLWSGVTAAVDVSEPRDYLFLAACCASLVLLFNLLLTLATLVRSLAKPVLIGVVLIAGTTAAFMQQYGVSIDRVMIQNVFETDLAETRELLGVSLLLRWVALGLVPAGLLAWVPIRARTLRRGAFESGASAVASLGAMGIVVLTFGADYASLLRNHRELRFMLTPTNALWYTASYLSRRGEDPQILEVVGGDARKRPGDAVGQKPMVFVLIIGEAARAEDFSLGGHERNTNPLLKLADGIYFSNVTACGTSTAVSLPCMFSDLGRSRYASARAKRRENLLDVVKRAGIDVLWLDNNSGCKGVCGRISVETFDGDHHAGRCAGGECFDEAMVQDLTTHIAALRRDTLIVLHQQGSHGPAYYLRYPLAFERFTPTCKSVRLSDCTREALHNTYDNTIVYTDFVVAQVIEALTQRADRIDSAALYVSDHGESLGESGVYLHGAPYVIAPDVQVRIPLYAWFTQGFRERSGLGMSCMQRSAGTAYSHDNLFHTTLGLLGVQTGAYRGPLDMFASCRDPAHRPDNVRTLHLPRV